MGLDQSGVLTVGSLVPKEGRHTLPHNTLHVIPPWCSKPPFFVGSPRSLHQGSPHATYGQQGIPRWVAANLISGHLVHAGNHRHGSAGHRQGQCSAHCTCEVRTQSVD